MIFDIAFEYKHKAMKNEIVRCSRRGYNLLKKKYGGAKRVPPNYIHFSRDTGVHLVPYEKPRSEARGL